jgi:hypothetical protein
MSKKHMGSSIDDFLKEEAYSKMRKRTSGQGSDRMATRGGYTLSSLQRAAAMVGRRVSIELV